MPCCKNSCDLARELDSCIQRRDLIKHLLQRPRRQQLRCESKACRPTGILWLRGLALLGALAFVFSLSRLSELTKTRNSNDTYPKQRPLRSLIDLDRCLPLALASRHSIADHLVNQINGTCATVLVVATVAEATCAAPFAPKLATVPGTRNFSSDSGFAIQAGSAECTTRYWLLCW